MQARPVTSRTRVENHCTRAEQYSININILAKSFPQQASLQLIFLRFDKLELTLSKAMNTVMAAYVFSISNQLPTKPLLQSCLAGNVCCPNRSRDIMKEGSSFRLSTIRLKRDT